MMRVFQELMVAKKHAAAHASDIISTAIREGKRPLFKLLQNGFRAIACLAENGKVCLRVQAHAGEFEVRDVTTAFVCGAA